jgi:hypothetical protein
MKTDFVFRLFTIAKIVLIVFVILVAFRCGPTKPKMIAVDPKFSEYVSAYTSGMISRKSTIRIELADVAPEHLLIKKKNASDYYLDSTVLKSIFTIEPKIEGKAKWVNDRVIEFIPNDTLPSNQLYTVYFDLKKVANVESGYEKFGFQFGTFTQKISVKTDGLVHQNEFAIDYMKLNGEISTTDVIEASKLKNCIWGEMKGKKYPVHLYRNWRENTYSFTIDSILRTAQEQPFKLVWKGTEIQSSSAGFEHIKVPALGDFQVLNETIKEEEDQRVDIYFSEPIHPSQNLSGLVTLEGVPDVSYQVNGNTVSLFLANRIVGERKLVISAGIQNFKGHKKLSPYSSSLTFHEPKPMVRIKGNGSILPNSNGLIFPFETVSL